VTPPVATVETDSEVLRGTGVGLRVRWLGTVAYREAWALQQALHADHAGTGDDRLLVLEHPPTYTLGRNADPSNVLVDLDSVGAESVQVDRGGDVTFHGPGQLVAYPILTLPTKGATPGGLPDTPGYVTLLEQVLIDTITELGLAQVGRQDRCPGVWVEPNTPRARKVAAIGVRIERGRSLHGIALNVSTDMGWFDHIVPCGIVDKGVTSLAAEGVDVEMGAVVDAFVDAFAARWRPGWTDRSDVVRRHTQADLAPFSRGEGPGTPTGGANSPRPAGASATVASATRSPAHDPSGGTSVRLLGRLAEAGVSQSVALTDRKPEWMRARVSTVPRSWASSRPCATWGW
jgi:lipoic acid synthetase